MLDEILETSSVPLATTTHPPTSGLPGNIAGGAFSGNWLFIQFGNVGHGPNQSRDIRKATHLRIDVTYEWRLYFMPGALFSRRFSQNL